MARKYSSEDGFIEVIVDPDFQGDIAALASIRPVWIVDSPLNCPRIDSVCAGGAERNLFEVNRCRYQDPNRRIENLLDIMGCIDDHCQGLNIVVHGLDATEVRAEIEAEGFRVVELRPDGFVALQDVAARDRLLAGE